MAGLHRNFLVRGSCCSCCGRHARERGMASALSWSRQDAAGNAARWHARSHRRRLPSVLGGWRAGRSRISRRCCTRQAPPLLAIWRRPRLTSDQFPEDVAEDTLEYVVTGDLRLATVGSSPPKMPTACLRKTRPRPHPHKTEGAFYLWTHARARSSCSGTRCEMSEAQFRHAYEQNAPDDPQGELKGKNVLYVASSIEEVADRTEISPQRDCSAYRNSEWCSSRQGSTGRVLTWTTKC